MIRTIRQMISGQLSMPQLSRRNVREVFLFIRISIVKTDMHLQNKTWRNTFFFTVIVVCKRIFVFKFV